MLRGRGRHKAALRGSVPTMIVLVNLREEVDPEEYERWGRPRTGLAPPNPLPTPRRSSRNGRRWRAGRRL